MIKKLILGVIFSSIVLFSGSLYANTQVTLSWDPNAPSDQVTEYWVYDNLNKIGTASDTNSVFIVPDGNHSFTITAWNKNGESIQSKSVDKVYFTAVPGQPDTPLATDEIVIP